MSGDGAATQSLELATFTPYRIAFLGRAMSLRLGAAYSGEGLTIPEWRVLAVVSQKDAVAARDVVERTPMDKMAVSRAVASLEAKELIQRGPAPDRRMATLRLTARGAEVFARVAKIALDYEASLLRALTDAERTSFFQTLEKIESTVNLSGLNDSNSRAAE
jgi:DNA-binding MarR family transcriptional regulator